MQSSNVYHKSAREENQIQIIQNLDLDPMPLSIRQLTELEVRIQQFWEHNRQSVPLFQSYLSNLQGKQPHTRLTSLKASKLRSDKKQCPICYQSIRKDSKVPSLKCKHKFHWKCLQKWMQQKASCPLCRDHIV